VLSPNSNNNMAAYPLPLRNAHLAVQTALDGRTDVLLTHEPGRPRPFVVRLRHPQDPSRFQGFCFETDVQVTEFMHILLAQVTGEPLPETELELVPHVPVPVVPKPMVKKRRSKAAVAEEAAAQAEEEQNDDADEEEDE
jgi:hypothetical protein